MAEDRAVLHEAVVKEDLLSCADVVAGEKGPAGGVDRPGRDRWVVLVSLVGEDAENQESEQHDQQARLQPTLRDDQPAFLTRLVDRDLL